MAGDKTMKAMAMKYCVRGIGSVQGGYAAELLMDMDAWCEKNCTGGFVLAGPDEIKFSEQADAERFAATWFQSGKWGLRKMAAVCQVEGGKFHHHSCEIKPEETA